MRTTVTLHPKTIDYLKDISEKTGLKRSVLLRLCLMKWFLANRRGVRFTNSAVKYQASDGIRFRRVHVFFSSFEYESFIDSRKFLKRSVSSIATEAIGKFASTIEENFSEEFIDLDTYPFPPYTVERKKENEYIKWNITWICNQKRRRKRKKQKNR